MQEIIISLVVLWRANSSRFAPQISTSAASFDSTRKQPRTSYNIYAVIPFYEALGIKATSS
jgi:hypothetical protein